MAKLVTRVGAAAAAVLLGAACTISSMPVGRSVEKRLLREKLSTEEFGARISHGGQKLQFTMFTGHALPAPVVVPMTTRFRGLPGLDTKLNGRVTARMLADTGAQLSVIDAGKVLEAGGRVYVPDRWDFTVTGIGGTEQAWLARFDELSFGTLKLRNFTTVVRRHKTSVKLGGLALGEIPINLLGCPVLLGFRYVTFDYAGKKLVFSPGTSYVPGPQAMAVPMTIQDQLVYVPLRIGNRTIPAMVDTGAKDEIFLNTDTVRALGLASKAKIGGTYRALGLGGESAGRHFNIPLAFLGETPVQNITIDTTDSSSWTARIGSELLERWKATFDFQRRILWLEPPTP